jgi:hypothetical protein
MITLASISRNKSGIGYVREELKKYLKKPDYFAPSFLLIAENSLRCFNLRKPITNKISIQEGCAKVIKVANGRTVSNENSIDYFIKMFLNLETLPICHKLNLENVIKKDLAELDQLLAHYNSLDVVKKYIKEPTTPRNHKERTILDFFKRTVDKKEKVITHLLSGLDDIAIERANLKSNLNLELKNITDNSKTFREFQYNQDFPYTDMTIQNGLIFKIDYEKLDYRKINPLRNKREYFKSPTDLDNGLTPKLKKEFKNKFTKNKALQLLDLILVKVSSLPILKDRKDIFAELKMLYKAKKWYGFYALALPQIEGIFSEMNELLGPKKRQFGSLSDKVQQVRPFYHLSEYFFDYYEYYLPEERNKFAHAGRMDNIKLKASFLIIDLRSIIDIFESLDTPLIELNNLIKEGLPAFIEIGKFRRFFSLLEVINPNHLSEIQPRLDNLIYNVLPSRLDIIEFINLLNEDFKKAASLFELNVSLVLHSESLPQFKILEASQRFLHANYHHIKKIFNNSLNVLFQKELQLLLDAYSFVTGFLKWFPNQNIEIKRTITEFQLQNENSLAVLKFLEKRIDVQIPDYVYLFAKDWKHSSLLQRLKTS